MPHPSYSSRFNHQHNIGWTVQIIKLLVKKFSPFPCYLVPWGLNTPLNTLFSNTLSLRFSLNMSNQVSHPYKTRGKFIVQHIWFLSILELQVQILTPRPNLPKLKPKLCLSKMK
jgi:hypothetical protein